MTTNTTKEDETVPVLWTPGALPRTPYKAPEPTEDQTPEQKMQTALEALREPFAPEAVGVLPKPFKKDATKGSCQECGGFHGLPAAHLNFVGHAAVTDRLLTVDPRWNWEPLAFNDDGLPLLDGAGGMWIKLTIAGVTRLGYGDGSDPKVRIGDAIRNAAMRFGVSLDLWTKDELESLIGNEKVATRRKPPKSSTPTTKARRAAPATAPTTDPETDGQEGMTSQNRAKLISHLAHLDPPIRGGDAQVTKVKTLLNLDEPVPLTKLTASQGEKLFEVLGIK
jgi:hypothetical protein